MIFPEGLKNLTGGWTYAAQKWGKDANEEPPRLQAEALWAEPFGVARLSLTLPPQTGPLGPDGLVVSEPKGRVFYPALDEGRLRALVREKTGLTGGRYTLYFLFTGKEPLEVNLRTPGESWTVRLVPGEHPRRWSRLLADWQEVFRRGAGPSEAADPLFMNEYLSTMLARRLGLDKTNALEGGRLRKANGLETRPERTLSSEHSGLWSFLGPELAWVFGAESLRGELLRERLEGRSRHWQQPAEHPLPEPPSPLGGNFPVPSQPPQIEPLASRVPEECFYIRFGGMAQFAWFRELLDWTSRQWTMCVAGKGLDYQLVRRSEERLCLRPTGWNQLLGRQLGGQVENLAVADVALIGLDLFQRDGSGVGVLFQARSEPLLRAELQRQRSEVLSTGQGKVHEQKLQIEGREVSLLTSEDGRIRSFYVADGPWHLVSTSRRLVERFLQTKTGRGRLADAPDFRAFRAKYPPQSGQTAFWYFSDAFWRTLCSPAYQVEIRRRVQAEADILLVEMARQAARSERRPLETIDALVAQGFLPPEFGPRSDGSRAVLHQGQVWDSVRGRRGYFIPIADMEVSRLTAAEVQQVEEYVRSVSTARSRLSPMVAVFRRSEPEKGRERISMEVYTYPLQSAVLETLGRFFGSASGERITPPPGDTAFVQWRLPQGRLFLGLRAAEPTEVRFGRGKLLLQLVPPGPQLLLQALRIGYVGRQGETPFLEMLDKLLAGRPDPDGYTGRPGGLWRRQIGPWVLYSFDRQILAEVGPLLRLEPTEQPAQVRLLVEDPDQSPLGQWLHQWAYQQAQGASLANLRLLSGLENQFHLSGEAALETAQQWLQARLVCPLGGRYEYRQLGRGGWHWTATALSEQPRPASAVLPPPIAWFRGLEGRACWQNREVQISLELLRQKESPSAPTAKTAGANP